ncbi:hypothetical protein [Bradyrhizobium elkanii]|uniref:hypothetical protein n=1 Tax=Bradyrhizobium elkanii TaxID=29448 RepID=UPI0009BEE3FB|nr:hypothetical protein [Bradyrhizobium elkanii]
MRLVAALQAPASRNEGLEGRDADTARPGSLLPDADLAAHREEAEKSCGRAIDETEFSAYLMYPMYPKIFTEFVALQRKYGPVSVLPTPVFLWHEDR